MAIRHIVTHGDPILRKECRPVGTVTEHIRETMTDMLETMRREGGVGIAGPQVGVMRSMFVAEPDPDAVPPVVYYMIDPVILETEGNEVGEEGCLSVPGFVGTVERPTLVRMEATDLDGVRRTYTFTDFAARVMCHETDHLHGILYTDKAIEVHEAVQSLAEDKKADDGTRAGKAAGSGKRA